MLNLLCRLFHRRSKIIHHDVLGDYRVCMDCGRHYPVSWVTPAVIAESSQLCFKDFVQIVRASNMVTQAWEISLNHPLVGKHMAEHYGIKPQPIIDLTGGHHNKRAVDAITVPRKNERRCKLYNSAIDNL